MLDAGRSLDVRRAETVARLRSQEPENWDAADVEAMREGVGASRQGIPTKRLFGSDFHFDTEGSGADYEYANAAVRPSFARGGLSNVWGGGMLPFHKDDIADWPIDASELDRHYADVLSFVPCSASGDGPENESFTRLFPFHCAPQSIPMPRQGSAVLRDAVMADAALARSGTCVGRARLAVHGSECRRCGMCLYGCPYGLIYNSESTLAELRTLPNFRYEPGFVVERLEERDGRVWIEGHDLAGGARRQARADRVLLGAGVLPSTAILLASLGDFDLPVRIQDSFYFLVPLLRFAGVAAPSAERLATLAMAFIAMRDAEVSEHLVLFSLYGYNDLTKPMLKATLGPIGGVEALASRMLAAGGYLHSKESPGLRMTLERGRILLEGEDSTGAIATAKKAAARLLRQSLRLRALPILPAMRFFPPGRGFHTGSSFPMRRDRVRHTSDIEGRPYGFDRVHLVDASCLPSIPATTITLPVMANAWRIANRAADRA